MEMENVFILVSYFLCYNSIGFFCREYVNKILNLGQFIILQSRVFEKIYQEWNQFKWDEKELNWICSRIHSKDPIVDPSKFDSNPIAYVDHLKN